MNRPMPGQRPTARDYDRLNDELADLHSLVDELSDTITRQDQRHYAALQVLDRAQDAVHRGHGGDVRVCLWGVCVELRRDRSAL